MSHDHSSTTTPLADTAIEITLRDLLAEYAVLHRFRNDTPHPIEAIYSFPIPLDAAFLGMQATLGGETLSARVMPARRATREYDDAIADGDSAVLIEQVEPGMLCVSLGSLQAGEQGEIVLRFAAALGVAGRIARFSLPLVHRPRYGRSRLLDHGTCPDNDFAVEHPLTATIRVRGLLADKPVQCTTHGAQFQRDGDDTVLRLDQAMLDRDLVLTFDLGEQSASSLRHVADGDASIGVLNFIVPHEAQAAATPRDICLLLDGSGSMAGDAIEQSRAALHALAAQLGEHDRIQVIRFGSATAALFRRPLRVTARVRAALCELADTVNADLGGTEMARALDVGLRDLNALDGAGQQKVIVLVTDGAVHARVLEESARKAAKAGIRIFVVAVGSSAGVDALMPLARQTRATLERAVPAEPIDAAVLRQLQRARQAAPLDLAIDWGAGATPLPAGPLYAGDAGLAIAFLPDHAPRTVCMNLPGGPCTFSLGDEAPELSAAWRAWAGQQACHNATADGRESLALRYGLITPETSAVLVKVRAHDEKAGELPTFTAIAHMQPAGMVGLDLDLPMFLRRQADSGPSSEYPAGQRRGRGALRETLRSRLRDGIEGVAESLFLSTDLFGNNRRPTRAQVEKALLHALFQLLFVDEPVPIDLDTVLAQLDAELRDAAARLLRKRGTNLACIADALALFDALCARYPNQTPALDDDQEARRGVVAAM